MCAQKTRFGRISYEHDHYGDEPTISINSSNIDLIHAYNWYSHFHVEDDAKKFVLSYFSKDKKKTILINKINAHELINIGWNCRILSRGGDLPDYIKKRTIDKLNDLMYKVISSEKKNKIDETNDKVISIQDRIENYANTLIADLEDQIDILLKEDNSDFNASEWFIKMNVKPQVAKIISNYYIPIYAELVDAYSGKDLELKESYSYLKRKQLKKYMEFIRSFIAASENQKIVIKPIRKSRKKKVKPASVLVAKMKFLKKDDNLDIKSVNAEEIIGSQQFWTFNIKSRVLTVYNAVGSAGLSIKGSTLIGFDETTSISKKLRKPKETLDILQSGGKIILKKLMSSLKTKQLNVNGRINKTTILMKVIR